MQLEKEMQLVRSFDHIVSISKSEAVLFEKHCGSEKTSWCMPFVNAPRVQLRNAWENDLLFVGSAHHANVESLKWFLREVYRPYLHPQGLSLAIVGDSGMQVDVTPFGDRVTCPGRVTRLEPWYQNSGLAVLPVVSGAGVPIKVIDAMTRGMPFVLTDFPAKAMGLTENVPVARTPLEFAQQVLNILCDPAERERRAVIGVEFVSKFASQDSYDSVWDKVLAHALSKGAN
jgi:hypothetical protein